MDLTTFHLLCKRANLLLRGVNESLSPGSARQYQAAFHRMQAAGHVPENIANTKSGFYYYRAAWVHHHATAVRALIANVNNCLAGGGKADALIELDALPALLESLQRYRPDPYGRHLLWGHAGRWTQEAKKRQRAGIEIVKHSKRPRLRGLPADWRSQMFHGLSSQSTQHAALAILSITGARPAEFQLGIDVTLQESGALEITIQGVKTHGGKYGQQVRVLTVAPMRIEAHFLLQEVRFNGGKLLVTTSAKTLMACVHRLSTKVFPRLRKGISPYVFRHQFAADLKASGMPMTDVSAALGHSVDYTKRYYGAATSAQGAASVSAVRASRPVIERTVERIRLLEHCRDHERSRASSRSRGRDNER